MYSKFANFFKLFINLCKSTLFPFINPTKRPLFGHRMWRWSKIPSHLQVTTSVITMFTQRSRMFCNYLYTWWYK